eukprot:SRR837773.6739.p1 GENE.SRR837773.6739~~SRR837773.6739.p1  ORF type:complete len:477 (-),score=6.27 SRR837773.6739:9-1439(-)
MLMSPVPSNTSVASVGSAAVSDWPLSRQEKYLRVQALYEHDLAVTAGMVQENVAALDSLASQQRCRSGPRRHSAPSSRRALLESDAGEEVSFTETPRSPRTPTVHNRSSASGAGGSRSAHGYHSAPRRHSAPSSAPPAEVAGSPASSAGPSGERPRKTCGAADWPLSREEKKARLLRLYAHDLSATTEMLQHSEEALFAAHDDAVDGDADDQRSNNSFRPSSFMPSTIAAEERFSVDVDSIGASSGASSPIGCRGVARGGLWLEVDAAVPSEKQLEDRGDGPAASSQKALQRAVDRPLIEVGGDGACPQSRMAPTLPLFDSEAKKGSQEDSPLAVARIASPLRRRRRAAAPPQQATMAAQDEPALISVPVSQTMDPAAPFLDISVPQGGLTGASGLGDGSPRRREHQLCPVSNSAAKCRQSFNPFKRGCRRGAGAAAATPSSLAVEAHRGPPRSIGSMVCGALARFASRDGHERDL